MKGAFHAYDIRGVYGKDFTGDNVYKTGFFLPGLLKAKKVLVGRDVRESSDEIFEALCKGITDAGADVFDAGLTTTPMVYWGTAKYGFHASVMITASHNPAEYNGMKISREKALPVGYDTGLKDIEEKIISGEKIVAAVKKGTVKDFDFKDEYLDFQKQYLTDLSGLNISVDCSNGMAALLIKDLLGDEPAYLNDELDGTFPGHEPNPLLPENVTQIRKAVLANGSDAGVIFDGDADRVMFIDEKGQFISPDLIIALLGHYFIEEKGIKGNVLQDIRTSKAVGEYIEKLGGKVHIWRVGRAYAAMKLREIDGVYGGELAGHYYFKDFYYSDSGIMAGLLVLRLLNRFRKDGMTFSSLIERIKKYANSGEINFRIENKKEAMDAVKEAVTAIEKPEKFYDFDGYRLEFVDWWFNIRPSNTEPYLRLLVEAKDEDLLNKKTAFIKSVLTKYM